MKKMMLLGVLLAAGTLMSARPARAAFSYHVIIGKAVGQDVSRGNTVANVMGGGLLQGTLAGSLSITGVTGTVATFTNAVTFTNVHGTLTATLTGMIDLTTGQYNATGAVTGGTGKLVGATGNISLSGVVNFATSIFAEDVAGSICVDLGQ